MTRKRILFLATLALVFFCGLAVEESPAQTAPAPTTQVALKWTLPASPWPQCTTSTTAACNDYFLVVDQTVASKPVTLNAANSLASTATTYTAAVPAGNVYATRLYALVLMFKDSSGAEVTGPTATCGSANTAPPCAVAVTPTTPPNVTGFTGTAVPAQ
jgi:hypothetical protein